MQAELIKAGNVTLIHDTHESYIADYGEQDRMFDSNFTLKITSEEEIKNFRAKGSCGCVTVKYDRVDKKSFDLNVHYNSKLLGRIIKGIKVAANGKELEIKLRGRVRN